MRRLVPFSLAAVAVVGFASFGIFGAADDKPKYTIKEVMGKAHKGKLLDKVAKGEASKDDKAELLALYTALHQNTPPKGDPKDWQQRTQVIVDDAKAVVEGKAGAEKKLKADVNCGACHKLHK